MVNELIRIEAPHFVAGIEIDGATGRYDCDDKLVSIHRCAPIVKYMKGWSTARIMRYCRVKRWKCRMVNGSKRP